MSDTFHIKRYREYLDTDADPRYLNRLDEAAHDDLATRFEQEHERNNQLEKMHHLVYKDLVRLEERIEEMSRQLGEALAWAQYHHHELPSPFNSDGPTSGAILPIPKGENN